MTDVIKEYVDSFDNEKLYVETRKNTQKPLYSFIISHGLGGDANSTVPLAHALLRCFPKSMCVSYDLRGHGKSSSRFTSNIASLEDIGARDLQSICTKLKIKNPVFVGHSLGGIYIQKYLEMSFKPQPQHSFVICSPFKSPNLSIKRSLWFKLLQQFSQGSPESSLKRTVKKYLNYRNSHDLNIARLFSDLRHTGTLKLPLLYFSVLGWQLEKPKTIFGPKTTLIYGNKDLFVRHKPDPNLVGHTGVTIAELNTNHHQVLLKSPKKLSRLIARQLQNHHELRTKTTVAVYFSIVIPTLNEEKYLPKLLTDLEKQLYQNFEVIIVDGGSTDKTTTIVESYYQLKVKVIHANKKNVAWQRNMGGFHAKGQWLIFIDADTQLPIDFTFNLKKQIQTNPTFSCFTTFASPDSGLSQDKTINKLGNLAILLSSLTKKPFTYGSCTGVSRTAFNAVGGYNSDLKISEDHDFVRKLVHYNYKFKVLPHPEVIFSFRRFRKEGRLKMIRKLAKIWLVDLTTLLAFDERDYPMLGGDYYHQDTQIKKTSFIDKFNKLTLSQKNQINAMLRKIKQTISN